jgi:hypothetical protein
VFGHMADAVKVDSIPAALISLVLILLLVLIRMHPLRVLMVLLHLLFPALDTT